MFKNICILQEILLRFHLKMTAFPPLFFFNTVLLDYQHIFPFTNKENKMRIGDGVEELSVG